MVVRIKGGQRRRGGLEVGRERRSAAGGLRLFGFGFALFLARTVGFRLLVFALARLFSGTAAFLLDLLLAGTPALTVAAASQASPMRLRSLSICPGFDSPTQLS